MNTVSVDEFYKQITAAGQLELDSILPKGITKEIGHFNVFSVDEIVERMKKKPLHAL